MLGTVNEGFTLRNKDYTETDDHLQHETLSNSVFFYPWNYCRRDSGKKGPAVYLLSPSLVE